MVVTAQTEGMAAAAAAAAAMLMQAMVLSGVEPTVLAMLMGAAVELLHMTGVMMIGVMGGGMLTAGAYQHQSGKGLTLVLVLNGSTQDLQLGHQAPMKDQWQAFRPDSIYMPAPVLTSQL